MEGIQFTEFPVVSVSSATPFDFHPFSVQTPLSQSLCPGGGALKIEHDSEEEGQELIRPVVLLQTGDSSPVVIDGYRQIRAARLAGLSKVPAFLLPATTPKKRVIHQALFGRSGGFSGTERVYAVHKTAIYARFGVAENAGGTAVIDDGLLPLYSRFFSREVSGAYLQRLLEVLKFPGDELSLLHALNTPADQLAALLDLETNERKGLLLLRSRIPFTSSGTRKLIRVFIYLRGMRPQGRFDLEKWVLQKASAYDSTVRDKDLICELRTISHPTLTRREESIEAAVRSLRFPSTLTLRPPENLEGDAFSCYFNFSSEKELEDLLGKIQDKIKDGSIKKLLEELNGD